MGLPVRIQASAVGALTDGAGGGGVVVVVV